MEDYIPVQRLDPAYEVRFGDGTRLDLTSSPAELAEGFRRFNPRDAERLPALLQDMERKYQNGRYRFIERQFNHLGDLLNPTTLTGMARAMPLESVWNYISRYIQDPRLRQALTFQTLYLGTSPFACPSIYGFLPYIEMKFGVWFPKGGMYAIAQGLAKLFQEMGGKIECNTRVRQIDVQGGAANGVSLADGRRFSADVVVSNCDVQTTYTQMLDPAHRPKNTDERMWKRDSGCSGYLLYLGVKRLPPGWKHHTVVLPQDYTGVMHDLFRKRSLPREPALYTCVPTVSDPSLAPDGHHVLYILAPVPHLDAHIHWPEAAPEFRNRCIQAVERAGWDGLEDDIVMERQWTPQDFLGKFGLFRGSAFGLTCSFWQSAYFRPHNRSEDIRNLYLVGASTHPGGGVPIVLTSARLVAEGILADAERADRRSGARTPVVSGRRAQSGAD
jgi:phytoene desaturase